MKLDDKMLKKSLRVVKAQVCYHYFGVGPEAYLFISGQYFTADKDLTLRKIGNDSRFIEWSDGELCSISSRRRPFRLFCVTGLCVE